MEAVVPHLTTSSSATGTGSSTKLSMLDPARVVDHIGVLLEATLGAKREELEGAGSLLSPERYDDSVQRCHRFTTESQVALYIQKEGRAAADRLEDVAVDEARSLHKYSISSDLSSTPTTLAFLVLLKRPQALDPSVPISSQIQVLNLPGPAYLSSTASEQGPGTSPYEILQLYLHNGLAPYFEASTKSQRQCHGPRSRPDVDAKTGIPVTKKRWTELELSLAHLLQNVEIPEVSLPFHPLVQVWLDDAASAGTKPCIAQVPSSVLQDSAFLNNLQATVNSWIKSIQVITKMTRDPATGTASQEINFWLSMEAALEQIENQLRSDGVVLTMEILKHAKRFQATVSFSSDTGLKEAMEIVQKYNLLMRDFPLDELLSAPSLAKVRDSITQILSHINKKMKVSPYPVRRALNLVEGISADLDEALHRLLPGTELVQLDYGEFNAMMDQVTAVFCTWDESVKEFTNMARDVTRRRQGRFIPIKIKYKHARMQERLLYVRNFRDNHEQLQQTMQTVLESNSARHERTDGLRTNGSAGAEEIDAIEEIKQAWDGLKHVDLLNVSAEGTAKWVRAENTYNERTARVENSIIARLRDRLATAKNANDMFRVFSKFNALFVRPKIRGAIAEYQVQLIKHVKQAIMALHERFKGHYSLSEAHAMAQLHDLPPISGAIIWAKQIERQLDHYMKKVEDVLGADWSLHAEGQKLQSESDLFRTKLDTRPVYEEWYQGTMQRRVEIAGLLFHIGRARSGTTLELAVNFDARVIVLFKETRNLVWLGYQVPHTISNTAKDAKRVYPYAVSLMESVRTFSQTMRQMAAMPEVAVLLNRHQNAVYALVAKGVPLKWVSLINSFDVRRLANGSNIEYAGGESRQALFVRDFGAAVSELQSKTTTLATVEATVRRAVKDLETCAYGADAFGAHLEAIQKAVDRLSLEQFVNLDHWVAKMNRQIKAVLQTRLGQAIEAWMAAFVGAGQDGTDRPVIGRLVHEITMRNQLISLEPPIEYARASWHAHLQQWMGIVCRRKQIKATRYQMSVNGPAAEEARFGDLASEAAEALLRVHGMVEQKMGELGAYVDQWLAFQSLWDLQAERVYGMLGHQLPRWLQCLHEIKKRRATFDTTELRRSFGHLTIDYEQVQTKVNAKYDQWQHDMLVRFAGRLGTRMREVYGDMDKARKQLEGQTMEASTAVAVRFITTVQTCQRLVALWAPDMDTFRQGESALVRQRYQFPPDWLHAEHVDHTWDTLNEVLARKAQLVQRQTDPLRAKIEAEDRAVAGRIAELTARWAAEKPVSGSIAPDLASATLDHFEARLTALQEEAALVARAKEALDLPTAPDRSLGAVLDEVRDFQAVWAALSAVWQGLADLRETPWASVQPRKVRAAVDKLMQTIKHMPSRMRQYAAFEHMHKTLARHLKVHGLLVELKSDAVRDRHWAKMYKSLRPGQRYSAVAMTLGHVWDLDLVAAEAVVRDTIGQAQGEMALEEFLKQVREDWAGYTLDLVGYQNKCRLIRGWDELFAKCSDHLNALQAMRHSPHYKQFEEEAAAWEDKLNRLHVLLDVWMDVQRQWVYLEGVFAGKAVAHLLPRESARFQTINSEFLAVMKKVQKQPAALEVLHIPHAQTQLERLAERLGKMQKALGEYLERERVSFPRFYFVGDEDLLEMIGNSCDTGRVAKHLAKMFAGLHGLVVDGNIVTGFASPEGEQVGLKKPIDLAATPRINDWLAQLEHGMRATLAELTAEAVHALGEADAAGVLDAVGLRRFVDAFPGQVVVVATQVTWTRRVEAALGGGGGGDLAALQDGAAQMLERLASTVLADLPPRTRSVFEQLITVWVHQRGVVGQLVAAGASSAAHHLWLVQMRHVYNNVAPDLLERLQVHMANATLRYGFEYVGVPERLVRTPLTDRCFLALTQALSQRLGGSPYGPAGTGKTESVKALGVELGRFTLVVCCDDTFDFQAMGRILLGLCRVGGWGCFDEFNRLEERILSAVSQQIQNMQLGLRRGDDTSVELAGRQLRVHANTGIFITMNPGYAGRSHLPDNLKKLFRSVAMSRPDKELIAEVMLYAQGFGSAGPLARQTVPFFDRCAAQLSTQAHYDFGLRALKSVLAAAGRLKRSRDDGGEGGPAAEAAIVVQSLRETLAPKLVRADETVMAHIERDCFPGVCCEPTSPARLEAAVRELARQRRLVADTRWTSKVLQLHQMLKTHHGVMLVGRAGSGKSAAWRLLLAALRQVDGVDGEAHVMDAKVLSKEALFGSLDTTTREWTDGLLTGILRRIVANRRGEDARRHWIVLDGDVDPEWVETLNSVLDDNRLLTLPNGERLPLLPHVRVLFEVAGLRYATPATVSRCGMVWFNDDTVDAPMLVAHYLDTLRAVALEDRDDDMAGAGVSAGAAGAVQAEAAALLGGFLGDVFVGAALDLASGYGHIMAFSAARALATLFSLLNRAVRDVVDYDAQHADVPLAPGVMAAFLAKKLLLALVWALAGDCPLTDRKAFGDRLAGLADFAEPPPLDATSALLDFDVALPRAEWTAWLAHVPAVDVPPHAVARADLVVPTLDTVRLEHVLAAWLADHKPLLLCGPPGAGKTMTLFGALRKLPHLQVVGLNFCSATAPGMLVKALEQHCEYRKTRSGVILAPPQLGRWLVIFCDEINLPAPDRYGTQRAIAMLRQLVELGGFWRACDRTWVALDRVQFVGACNPPSDAGRSPLAARFLRHAPLVMVDYPGQLSLGQIYGTFNAAVLKSPPGLAGLAGAMTSAMVGLYRASQRRFTPAMQPHYVYSPRELTRWVRGIYEAVRPLDALTPEGLVRIWAHEALRLFQDRLVDADERRWTADAVARIAADHFSAIDLDAALQAPILFSNWLSKDYVPVGRAQLRDFVAARLRTFCDEQVDVPLVLFDDVLEHVLRIDRVFRQPQGHLMLIGVSGSGKTTLARFVAWINGLKVFQLPVHGRYRAHDFDDDLRHVLRRCGCRGERICFLLDEANVLEAAFLERMNTLLANAEVPGLFEGDDLAALTTACKEAAQRQGLLLDSSEELHRWFTGQIAQNLHVVFTMNPPEDGLSCRAATSPALFNRCVLNWFGDWSDRALFQVAHELTSAVDLDRPGFVAPDAMPIVCDAVDRPASHRHAVVNAMVYVHRCSLPRFTARLRAQQARVTFLTPRHFLDFVAHFVRLHRHTQDDLEEQQRHLHVGLEKLHDTVRQVRELRASLAEQGSRLALTVSEANDKLQRMMADQREAEQRQSAAIELQAALERQEVELASRRRVVLDQLADAEPAVESARAAVGSIKKSHLAEVQQLPRPPEGVRLALEAVCAFLGKQASADWRAVKAVMREPTFVRDIVGFRNELQMTKALRARVKKDYLSNPEFTYEKVNRASKACGPLVEWVTAQVRYADALDSVGPLKAEVDQLEDRARDTKAHAMATQLQMNELEAKIVTCTAEYATLISNTQTIRTEMARVQAKVERSEKLLASLAAERARWELACTSFESQMATLVGDVLVAAAFLAYAGLFDQVFRKSMMDDWLRQLDRSGIRCKPCNPVAHALSTADERLGWQQKALPVDDLCTENAIILQRAIRYPLIIDPSGRVVDFLRNSCRGLAVTSFLDDSFANKVESALRFGNPILIQDAEHLDPILTHVLNKQYQRTGGRVLVQLGKQQIDFSPAFQLYLATRDPSASFAPDICSRTTLVNFTVTPSSLQTQSLNDVLKAERPDVDERRCNLIKLQGEFKLHLLQLEKGLLQALNESRGHILDDDRLIETLETLKTEAADIAAKMASTRTVMADVDAVTRLYRPVARACSAIFAVLDQLRYLSHLYQFSLHYFVDMFHAVLHAKPPPPAAPAAPDHDARRDLIIHTLYVTAFQRTALALLQPDRITLAVLLAQASPYPMDKSLLDVTLDDAVAEGHDLAAADRASRDDALARARRLRHLGHRIDRASAADWDRFFDHERAEDFVPAIWDVATPLNDQALYRLLLVKLFRLDRFVLAAERFAVSVFGPDLFHLVEDLAQTVDQVSATRPIALVSSLGFDASYKVDSLVARVRTPCTNIAMGSTESLASADTAIAHAAQTGSWVLVKNVHLAPPWLQSLEKRMDSLNPHPDFRLFLSMESSPTIPVNLLRAVRVLMYEQPAGVRANMRDSMASLATRPVRAPVERMRLYLLLSFLHAVLQERLRYAPHLGWKGFWEFNDADYECALFVIDTWIDAAAQNRSNIAPHNIPWHMIRYLVRETYGGKVDDEHDYQILDQLVCTILTPAAFEEGHKLVCDKDAGHATNTALTVPLGTSLEDFMAWIQNLPEREPPTYLGLPANAEKLLLVGLGRNLVTNLKKISDLLDEEDAVMVEEPPI